GCGRDECRCGRAHCPGELVCSVDHERCCWMYDGEHRDRRRCWPGDHGDGCVAGAERDVDDHLWRHNWCLLDFDGCCWPDELAVRKRDVECAGEVDVGRVVDGAWFVAVGECDECG